MGCGFLQHKREAQLDMVIREINLKDAEKFWQMQSALDKETKFMMLEPDERKKDIDRIKGMIENIRKANDFLFVVEENDELIGFITANRGTSNRTKHRAYVVIGIRKAFQGRGLGTKLFSELDKWAVNTGIHRLELTVMVQNVTAKALYEKCGFVVEGVKKDSMCVDGEYVDEYYMSKVNHFVF